MRSRRSPQLDLYAALQVSPRATAEEIEAAYERLMPLYVPERTTHAAPEVQELAARRREQIDAAYAVLRDHERRAAYDHRYGSAQPRESLDYRPLDPARGQERTQLPDESAREVTHPARNGLRAWLLPLGVTFAAMSLLLLLVLSGVRTSSSAAALATPVAPGVSLPFTATQIAQFRAAAEAADDFDTWRALGNALFDNMQTLRENAPQSPQYRNTLDVWLEAAGAYEQALQLHEDDIVRSDHALTLFNYGTDRPEPSYVEQALADVERGIAESDSSPRALINYGIILALSEPPRTDEALQLWQRVLDESPESLEAQRAEALIRSFER